MLVRINILVVCLLVTVLQSTGHAGWPFFSEDGLRRGTPEYYEAHANDPVGARQRYAYGLAWPPQARPCGPKQSCVHKYYASHYWPYPYHCQDRATVRSVMDTQVNNGWIEATTLHWYHFDPITQDLNSSGKQHLRWVLSHAPVQHRQTYVASGTSSEENAQRMAAVEREAVLLVGAEQMPSVLLRVADPSGRPALEVQNILLQAESGRNAPIIPFVATGSGGGSGGGGTQ
ncbi:MAG: hypothetical protein KDA58_11840 [Planctomycetaceae bacterium]|nr:hypothetical protein [Planctomycetaceae bacterium]